MKKPGRNDPCPCGSGKKYKKCCLINASASIVSLNWRKMRRTEGELIEILLKHAEKYYSPEAIAEAWDEFSLWRDVPIDSESEPELDTIFLPWFVFNWIPDNAEVEAAEHYPEMPVALHYLEHKGSRLDAYQVRFINKICAQHYSFFMVTEVVSGKQMTLKDLLLGRDLTVTERQASITLRKGSIIYTRIITMDDTSIMVGCAPFVIPPAYINEIIDIREAMTEQFPDPGHDMLYENDLELREIYYAIREELHNPILPQLQNTDDDPLQLTKLYYTLECTPNEALDALATLSMVDADDFIQEAGTYDNHGKLVSIKFPWLKKGNKHNKSWDNTVMGHIFIDGEQLIIDVNSQQRADAIKRKITRRLGRRAVFRNAMITSAEKMLEDLQNEPREQHARVGQDDEELMALPEVQEKIREMAEQHWKGWVDTPIPALKDQTPRQAAKSDKGRERLEALLLQFEQRDGEKQPFDPDVDALRRSLGLS